MILREEYLAAIRPFIDTPLVKILTGIRRCGKSTIFLMLHDELLKRGAAEKAVIFRRYTDMDLEGFDQRAMYDDLKTAIAGKGRC